MELIKNGNKSEMATTADPNRNRDKIENADNDHINYSHFKLHCLLFSPNTGIPALSSQVTQECMHNYALIDVSYCMIPFIDKIHFFFSLSYLILNRKGYFAENILLGDECGLT